MTMEEKVSLIRKKALEGRMKFKKELKENLILGSKIERPKQGFGTFEENLYKWYQRNNPPQFEIQFYIDDSYGDANLIYLGRFPANRCSHKENFPELKEVDLFVQRCEDNSFTLGYRHGEHGDYASGKWCISHCPAFHEAAIRSLNLKIISQEEYMKALFYNNNLKINFRYFVTKVLEKHKNFDDFITKYIEEE